MSKETPGEVPPEAAKEFDNSKDEDAEVKEVTDMTSDEIDAEVEERNEKSKRYENFSEKGKQYFLKQVRKTQEMKDAETEAKDVGDMTATEIAAELDEMNAKPGPMVFERFTLKGKQNFLEEVRIRKEDERKKLEREDQEKRETA